MVLYFVGLLLGRKSIKPPNQIFLFPPPSSQTPVLNSNISVTAILTILNSLKTFNITKESSVISA